ncbi:phosphate ABC transporter substrate-binding/OmpA family protein [Fimbriimonas ginsengisoli]|uniref:Outer membrane lipoprotein omp16 n=1 Tax=Fimbriimonas ginsengisoli Gsoil 348 TaxID=661478 RepID=A0A068NRQ5_FIMGI|nr:phosphate ABC transporter substrate-binding/OmpA family protein [Fimbriimonas ginsengisoli]AIE84299.1 Outer membrane lipoprotein omp16 precursor [Fimbriimonas ginsengisoli Gsoil 348]
MRLKTSGKVVALIVVVGVAVGVARVTGIWEKLIPSAPAKESKTVGPVVLPGMTISSGSGHDYVMPGSEAGCADKPEVRMLGYAWNAQMGIHFANGGAQASSGSLMCKYGVNLKWSRQDNNDKLAEALVTFANAVSNGQDNPTVGAHFMTMMGDGSAVFLKGLNDTLRRLGPEYQAKIVGVAGYSRGEDKFMGPSSWMKNALNSRGGVVAGVIRDGDWNIALKWLADNGLKNNPDEKTWDPDALNWINASDYLDACQKYIGGYTEQRAVVKNGKRTGETKTVHVDGVVTWTPGDVQVAQQKGGLVSIVSTKEYASQMPCVIIGIDKWMKKHPELVKGMLRAIADGSDAVKSSPVALHKAAEVSAAVYQEKNSGPEYWEKYYKGTTEPDKTGQQVDLGGSSVTNLGDMQLSFGLLPGSQSLVAATYKAFGDVVVSQYPEIMSSFPGPDQVIDTSFLSAIVREAKSSSSPGNVTPTKPVAPERGSTVISKRRWNITFETGRAKITPAAMRDLERMRRDLVIASGAAIEIHGHTDNQGDPAKNMQLSEARAFAVQKWLEQSSPVNFPSGRIQVYAHGSQNPIQPNSTGPGRAANRRVEIWLLGAK